MSKLFFLLVVIAALALSVNADADPQFPNYFPFGGNFPGFPMPAFPPMKFLTPDDIKNMQPQGPNSHVVGASVSSQSSSEVINGVPVKNHHKSRVITNNDGKVTDNSYGN